MTSSSSVQNTGQAGGVGINQVGSRTFVSGFGLGFDTSGIINAAVQQRERPAVLLDAQVQENLAKIEAYNSVSGIASNIQAALDKLKFDFDILGERQSAFDQKSGTLAANTAVDPTSLLSVGIGPEAAAGSYNIVVDQIAQQNKVQSGPSADASAGLGYVGTFEVGIAGQPQTAINVDASMSLTDIANQINAVSGITASVLQTGENEFRLIVTSDATNQELTFADTAGTVLNDIGVLAAGIPNEVQAEQPARLFVDGVLVTRDSNDIQGILPGVDFSVVSADPGTTLTLQIDNDVSAVSDAINEFIAAYNELRSFITAQNTLVGEGVVDENSILFGDTILRSLDQIISPLLSAQYNTTGTIQSLRDLEIDLNSENLLVIADNAAFESALINNLDEVRGLFEVSFTTSNNNLILNEFESDGLVQNFTLDITTDGGGNVTAASAGGVAFDVTPEGLITGQAGTAYEGIIFTYSGGVDASINVDMQQGFASVLERQLNNFTDFDGIIVEEVIRIEAENTDSEQRAARIRESAASYRDRLIEQYAELEAQVRQAETIQRQIRALFGLDNNDD